MDRIETLERSSAIMQPAAEPGGGAWETGDLGRLRHDLRSRLTVILGYSSLVLRRIGESPDNELAVWLGRLQQAALEMEVMLRRPSGISKGESDGR